MSYKHNCTNMKKIQIEIPIILPGVPDDKDPCVKNFIKVIREEKGVEDVHVIIQIKSRLAESEFLQSRLEQLLQSKSDISF